MVGLSPQGEVNVLNSILSSPGSFISLHTADPGNTGANEVAGGATGYLRQDGSPWNSGGSNPTQYVNANAVVYPVANANWGTLTHFGLWTDPMSTNPTTYLGSGQLSTSQAINANDVARFLPGALVFLAD